MLLQGALLGLVHEAKAIERGSQIAICYESNLDWPPYEYYQRVNEVKTETLAGFSVDVLEAIFAEHGLRYAFVFYPWKRCLAYLATGEGVQMVLPTSVNDERERKYLVSDSVYTVTPSYFYRRERYPAGLSVDKASELLQHGRVCGRLGYNYHNFGIDSTRMDTGAKDFDALMRKLNSGHCDIILERYEIVAGLKLIGKSYLSSDIAYAPIPGSTGESFHYLISKHYRYGQELLRVLNTGIAKLRRDGKLKEMLQKQLKD